MEIEWTEFVAFIIVNTIFLAILILIEGERIMANIEALNERVGELEAQAVVDAELQQETANTLTELVALVAAGGSSPDQTTIDALTDRLTELRDKTQARIDAGAAAEQAADPTP